MTGGPGYTYDEFVDLLTGRIGAYQRAGQDSVKFRCPLHDDIRPSLSVSQGDDDQPLVYCHGCVDGAVWERLLDWLDGGEVLTGAAKPKGSRRDGPLPHEPLGPVVAQYEYHDTEGRPVALKLRHDPKDFRWRAFRGGGYSVAGLGGITLPPLFRLHELPERATATGQLWLVEGEKDSDRLWSLGLAATCTPHGSSRWMEPSRPSSAWESRSLL